MLKSNVIKCKKVLGFYSPLRFLGMDAQSHNLYEGVFTFYEWIPDRPHYTLYLNF